MISILGKSKPSSPSPFGSSPPEAKSEHSPSPKQKVFDDKIQKAHQSAMDADEPSYRDPSSGYSVMTEKFLKQRGSCCQSGCRHCPYGFIR
ncbi:MAG: hypothetical protein K2X66_04595 [Cyanobacteria bacterium]|nr:hypothetical protein [Cyanobacteriota bacterium]